MQISNHSEKLQYFISRDPLLEHLDSIGLKFMLVSFEKEELIGRRDRPLGNLLFLVSGQVQIYDLDADGEKTPMALITGPELLGDMEFCRKAQDPFYSEAVTDVFCLALPIEANRQILEQDAQFLLYLADSLSEKLEAISESDARTKTVRERVLYNMEHVYPDGVLQGVEKASLQLRCSRRQLQRVLRDLCEEGKLEQTGRGKYRFCKEEEP